MELLALADQKNNSYLNAKKEDAPTTNFSFPHPKGRKNSKIKITDVENPTSAAADWVKGFSTLKDIFSSETILNEKRKMRQHLPL